MPQEVIEKDPKLGETAPQPNYRVVLINDDHNSFDHVIKCLKRHIPGMSEERAQKLTVKVHNEGSAVVWRGPKEPAEMYSELLKAEGLTTRLEADA
jgi:ATP-dependent Clp protease adaptor protein ClpS